MVDSFQGKDLVNFGYEPFYNPSNYRVPSYRFALFLTPTLHGIDRLVPQVLPGYFTYPIIAADFVSMEEGTGIVHVAPAFGEVDFEVGKDNGLDFVQPVDLGGQIIGSYPFSGKFVKDADELILADLEKRGLLYRRETIVHTYPFCWRCDAPLLYYAKRAWYIRTTAVKDKLISGNAEINWYPDYIKYGRFGDWLENNVDWAFSRERYWGTPLPIWHCESCGDYDCIGSMEELENKPGIAPSPIAQIFEKGELDLHRPYMDKITYDCPKCGGEMRRVPEVIDCWFDSGAMPIAQWHFPFENRDTLEQSFPADFVCEAVDQTRGWFYSLHALSTLLFEQPCFKNVICLGHIVDAQGKKMSKAEGNVIDPWAVINHHGADAIRWYLLTSAPAGNVRRFSTKMVTESIRKFLLTLWNTYSFFTLYANIDHFVPQPCHYDRNEAVSPTLLDKWIISELNRLIGEVTKGLDNYDPNLAARRIESFVDALSNWYVRQSRRRFWKSENDADKLAAYTTLYQCLVTLSQLLAPLTPFIAEELYQNLVRSVDSNAQESVHLTDFPVTDEAKIDDRLNEDVELAIKISSLGRAARAKAGIKVRQPLPRAVVRVRSEGEIKALQRSATEIMREVNIKEMEFSEEESLPDMPGYSVAGDARRWVAVSTELTPELVVEGISREVVRHLQSMRRAAKFDVADYIVTYYQAEEQIRRVMVDFADYIKQETLSYELIDCIPPEGAYSEKHRISDSDVLLAVKKVIQPHGGGLFSS